MRVCAMTSAKKKAGGGQNAGNPLGLVGGKEKKFDQKKKFFNSQVRFREIKFPKAKRTKLKSVETAGKKKDAA